MASSSVIPVRFQSSVRPSEVPEETLEWFGYRPVRSLALVFIEDLNPIPPAIPSSHMKALWLAMGRDLSEFRRPPFYHGTNSRKKAVVYELKTPVYLAKISNVAMVAFSQVVEDERDKIFTHVHFCIIEYNIFEVFTQILQRNEQI